ncbi:SxtJ family membrane protein [uncultured Idiomarina sp.]|uniref:SxtJ family membrane protein n=1 Tax=uncultured Idiomarina sp. TaxID=352961 RepID=UPI0025914E5A|nr:SxtJ family membrane protein [uncultured Idiomarina sp.]
MNIFQTPRPDQKLLCRFGIILGISISAIFTVIHPWLTGTAMPWWPVAVSTVLLLCSFVWPKGLSWPYRLWMELGLILGAINTRIILLVIFVFIILPTAMVLRFFGVGSLKLRFDSKADSYRQKVITNKSSMEKPY